MEAIKKWYQRPYIAKISMVFPELHEIHLDTDILGNYGFVIEFFWK